MEIALFDTIWLFNQTVNRAQKWFNSIFNSKWILKYSFNQKNHSKASQKYSIQYSIQEFGGKWFKMPSGPEYVLSAQN